MSAEFVISSPQPTDHALDVDLLKSRFQSFEQDSEYSLWTKERSEWRIGTKETHLKERTFLPSLKTDQLWFWKPCSAAWFPQNAPVSLYFCSSTPNYFVAVGNNFFQPCYTASSCAVLKVQCPTTTPSAEAWAQLLRQQPFPRTWGFRNDKNRFPCGSCLKEQWYISYIHSVCFGSPWYEINREQEQQVKLWGLQWQVKRSVPWYCLLLLCSCWTPVMWQLSTSVRWHSSAQFPSRLLCTRLLCLSRNPGCQRCINAHSLDPEVETHRFNAFYSLLSEKCNLLTTTVHC